MKPPTVILILLIGAFVLGDVASTTYLNATHQRWPDVPGIILLGLVFGQLTLVSAWFAYVRWNIAVRVLVVIPSVFGLSFVAALATDGRLAVTPWFAILLVAFCAEMLPLMGTTFFRWQITREGETGLAAKSPSWQFSIWGLLSGTTAVAVALGTARLVNMPLVAVGEAAAFFTCVAATGLLVFFVAMGIQSPQFAPVATIPVVAGFCPFAGILTSVTGLPPEEHPVQWALFGFCYGVAIAVSALALRIAGYRLSRVPVAAAESEDLQETAKAKNGAVDDGKRVVKRPSPVQVPDTPDVVAPRASISIHRNPDDD